MTHRLHLNAAAPIVRSIDKQNQIETRRHIFEVTAPDGEVTRKEFETRRRYSFPGELDTLFAECGLAVESVFAGYEKEIASRDSEQMVYVLGKA